MNQQINYHYANLEHLDWLSQHDQHLAKEQLHKKIVDQQILIAQLDALPIAWLRFGWFWDAIPFMNLLFVLNAHRGRDIGRNLVRFWEEQMQAQNHPLLMTSTQSDEQAQHFYRKLAYTDAGALFLPQEASEIIFIKQLVIQ